MTTWFNRMRSFFVDVPDDMRAEFDIACAQKNNTSFFYLPFLNILAQVSCILIYLFIYPRVLPEQSQMDPTFFSILSAGYIAANVLFALAFYRLKQSEPTEKYVGKSGMMTRLFLLFYVLYECFEMVIELQVSGSIYRLLVAVGVIALLPAIKRRDKTILLVLFGALAEIGIAWMIGRGFTPNNMFSSAIYMFVIAFVPVSMISYNESAKTFTLNRELIRANQQLSEANRQLEHMTVIDALTGIYNRRAFDQYMSKAWSAGCRDGSNVSVIMVDIDNLKQLNDAYGHQKGDECLVAVAQCLKKYWVRETDMCARYGGEEFAIVAVKTPAADVFQLVEKMRKGVEEMRIENPDGTTGGYVTVSAGVTTVAADKSISVSDVIKKADDALYGAKREGRNRTVVR